MVLENLIGFDVTFTNGSEQSFVIQKVTSTLAAVFMRSFNSVRLPVRKLSLAFIAAHTTLNGDADELQNVWARAGQATARQVRSLLWLSSSLVEEAGRSDLAQNERLAARLMAGFC